MENLNAARKTHFKQFVSNRNYIKKNTLILSLRFLTLYLRINCINKTDLPPVGNQFFKTNVIKKFPIFYFHML